MRWPVLGRAIIFDGRKEKGIWNVRLFLLVWICVHCCVSKCASSGLESIVLPAREGRRHGSVSLLSKLGCASLHLRGGADSNITAVQELAGPEAAPETAPEAAPEAEDHKVKDVGIDLAGAPADVSADQELARLEEAGEDDEQVVDINVQEANALDDDVTSDVEEAGENTKEGQGAISDDQTADRSDMQDGEGTSRALLPALADHAADHAADLNFSSPLPVADAEGQEREKDQPPLNAQMVWEGSQGMEVGVGGTGGDLESAPSNAIDRMGEGASLGRESGQGEGREGSGVEAVSNASRTIIITGLPEDCKPREVSMFAHACIYTRTCTFLLRALTLSLSVLCTHTCLSLNQSV